MNNLTKYLHIQLVILISIALSSCSSLRTESSERYKLNYNPGANTLSVFENGKLAYKYIFNRCGGINSIYDEVNSPGLNLIAKSYAGETSDRVIQWTYWNSAYLGMEHGEGDGDRRLNVTMEGSFGDKELCIPREEKFYSSEQRLVFESKVNTWFYSNLNSHGRVEFHTHLEYQYQGNGVLYILRTVQRKPAKLKNIFIADNEGDFSYWTGQYYRFIDEAVQLKSKNQGKNSFTSYLETWVPFDGNVLPYAKAANGNLFKQETLPEKWYQNWDPKELGGWVMAYREDVQAVALIFGLENTIAENSFATFNRIYKDESQDALNVLLHGIETDIEANEDITQNYFLVVGKTLRVKKISDEVILNLMPRIGS